MVLASLSSRSKLVLARVNSNYHWLVGECQFLTVEVNNVCPGPGGRMDYDCDRQPCLLCSVVKEYTGVVGLKPTEVMAGLFTIVKPKYTIFV